MLAYLDEFGYASFDECPFNDVDRLVFAQLSYCDFSVSDRFKGKPVSQAAKYVFYYSSHDRATSKRFGFQIKDDKRLLYSVILAKRYSEVKFIDFIDEYDMQECLQFSALTLGLPDGNILVAFRGTDITLAGWKEDCEMAFDMPIPSQTMATDYLKKIACENEGNIYICGHSKGGNLAIYSSVFVEEKIQERIVDVTNFDGPGLPSEIKELDCYKAVEDRIGVIIPKCSIVGMFFEQPKNVRYVESRLTGVLQHYPYFWKTDGCNFLETEALAGTSELFGNTMRTFLSKLEREDREKVVETVYEIIQKSQAETLDDLPAGIVKNILPIATAILSIKPEMIKVGIEVITDFLSSVAQVIRENMVKDEDKTEEEQEVQ